MTPGHSRPLKATQGHSRPLQATQGHSRPLQATPGLTNMGTQNAPLFALVQNLLSKLGNSINENPKSSSGPWFDFRLYQDRPNNYHELTLDLKVHKKQQIPRIQSRG